MPLRGVDTLSREGDEHRNQLAEALQAAPDRLGWRAGMDADDYRELADALIPLIDSWLDDGGASCP